MITKKKSVIKNYIVLMVSIHSISDWLEMITRKNA